VPSAGRRADPTIGHSVGALDQDQPMKHFAAVAASVAILLVTVVGCSSSQSSSTSSSTTTPQAPATGAGSSDSSTTAGAVGGDTAGFCSRLATGVDKAGALIAAVGTAELAAKLAEVKADNDAIVAAAPGELRDSLVKFYAISEVARRALDPGLSAADKRAAATQAAAAAGTPEAKAAIADYKSWVQANCGALSAKILSGAG